MNKNYAIKISPKDNGFVVVVDSYRADEMGYIVMDGFYQTITEAQKAAATLEDVMSEFDI